VEKSTHAACEHLKEAYDVFKNWTLAAAAYNRGIGGIQNAMENQKADSYFDLLLNPETGSFVYRILAYKTLLSNPAHFGIRKKLQYAARPSYNVLAVDSSIGDLAAFARQQGISLITLRSFNPWLRRNTLPNPGGIVYDIRVPKNPNADYGSYAIDMLPEGDPLAVYVKQPAKADSVNQDTILSRQVKFAVKIDEPLASLARFLKVKEEDIRRWNNLKEGENAVRGQTLVIYYRN
jgi:hypothetical protein